MWIKKPASVFLFAVLLCLAVCQAAGAEIPETQEPESAIQVATGADSVRTLLEKTAECIQNDGDYSMIAGVHDQQACMAYHLIIMLYDSDFVTETVTEITWDEAMEKAALLFGDTETLSEKDPDLAERIKSRMHVIDPDEAVNTYMSRLREAFRNSEIAQDDPSYEMLSAMLTDWDKGTDYMLEHYGEFLSSELGAEHPIGMDKAIKVFRESVHLDYGRYLKYFKDFQIEYHPENSDIGNNGTIFHYDIGTVSDPDGDGIRLKMIYYVKDTVYYLIDYNFTIY